MSFYLFEIGCEELPAAFVPLTVKYVREEAAKFLDNMKLHADQIISDGTPRRIYLYINGLPEMQQDREESVQGPPAKIAFKEDGSLSDVGLKFVESKGLNPATVKAADTPKGPYLSGIKEISGEKTSKLMAELAAHIVKNIPFPKSMRWGNHDLRFGRPLHYVMSIWDGKLLKIDIDDFETTDTTVGHRFLAPDAFKVADYDSYINGLVAAKVIVDSSKRESMIKSQLADLAAKGGYEAAEDEELLKTVVNLVEYPYAVEGAFDEIFLELPAPVLITSMRHHQKYFPVSKNGKLLAKFIGISNMEPAYGGALIKEGYERVLKARLNDALFFYNNDKKKTLDAMAEMLKKVTYQEKLGSSYEKMERFRAIAVSLAKNVAPDREKLVERAASIAKADLMSEMVYEFPELQGFMGKVYAGFQKEDPEVAAAIEEHYMPRFAGDALPSTTTGKLVAIADKLDSITGAFSIDMIPTGNLDPYALRRNAIGIINIIEGAQWRINLNELVKAALELVKSKATVDLELTRGKVMDFFLQRHKQLLIAAGECSADAYDAAAVNFTDFISQREKAAALTAAKQSESFVSIAQSFKRVSNILKKNEAEPKPVDESLFEQDEEKALYKTLKEKSAEIKEYASKEDWNKAIASLTAFAAPLEAFFDKVMVMAKDDKIKNNRLALLSELKGLFGIVGDLGEII